MSKVDPPLHNAYEICWRNFRCFQDTGWRKIRPLTIIIGPNNSGKSSFIDPLLLMGQTFTSRDNATPLVMRGNLADLGNYRDVVHMNDENREIFFGIRYHVHKPGKDPKPVGTYPPGILEATFASGNGPQEFYLSNCVLYDVLSRTYIGRKLGKANTYGLRGAVSLSDMEAIERKAVRSARPRNFLFSPTLTIAEMESLQERDEPQEDKGFSEAFSHYLRAVGFALSELAGIFQSMSYVGPLRMSPQRYYQVAAETPRSVGAKGENAPNLLRSALINRKKGFRPKLNKWIRKFNFGDSLIYEDVNDDLFSLIFEDGGRSTNYAEVGFGASQIVPLIIQSLAAPEDSLTIAEQPEIHLNPRLQSVLAELLVDMALSGHRVIVETHSEHLLLRLRRLVAENKIDPDDVALYFTERKGTESKIYEVPIKPDGGFREDAWPEGFFDDVLRESMALSLAQWRRAKKDA